MHTPVSRKLFSGIVPNFILNYAKKKLVFGEWLMKEWSHCGYELSARSLCQELQHREKGGFRSTGSHGVNSNRRIYDYLTAEGNHILIMTKEKIHSLTRERAVALGFFT